jgi:PGF-pre-PGF domain-containing protein
VSAPANAWNAVESWSGTVSTVSNAWTAVENWTGTVSTTVPTWQPIETWTGTVTAAVGWTAIETWTGVISGPDTTPPDTSLTTYLPDPTNDTTPSYSGTATDTQSNVVDIECRVNGGAWTDVDPFAPALSVNFTFTTPVLSDGTYTIEVRAKDAAEIWETTYASDTLTISTYVPPVYYPPAADFSISVAPTSRVVTQGGSTTATISITPSGGYSYTVALSASGQPSGVSISFSPENGTPSFTSTMNMSVSRNATVGSYTITVTGAGADGKTHSTTFTLKINELPAVFPVSSVNAISPYWQTSVPITITAAASDNDGSVVSVALYSRYSGDNSTWENWTLFAADTAQPWSWLFTAEDGAGYYEFYSAATDNDNYTEPAPAYAQARCGVDTTTPPAPALVPQEITNNIMPTFDWSDITDLSGATYELVISSSADFSSPVLRKTGLTASEYTPSASEALAEGVYCFRVRATDVAGNASAWTGTQTLVIRTGSIPTIGIEAIPAGGTIAADFSAYRMVIVRVAVTVKQSVSSGEIRALQIGIEELAEMPEWAAAPSGVVYKYLGIITTSISTTSIQSTKVEIKVPRSWIEQNNVNENTIKLLRWANNRWENLPTTFIIEDNGYLSFEASAEGFSLWGVAGEEKPSVTTVILPVMPPMIIFALLSMFGVIGGGLGYFVYIRKIRPIPQIVPLRRLIKVSRPAAEIPKAIVPSVKLEMLKPVPVTQAFGVPTEPVEPVPITTRPVIPSAAPTFKTLTILQKVRPAQVPGILKITGPAPISLPQLVKVARPVAPISLAQLAKVARPVAPTTPLGDLAKVAREAPAIEMKRLEATVRPVEPAVVLEKLKMMIDAKDKTAALEQLKKKDSEKRTDGGTRPRKGQRNRKNRKRSSR